MIAGPASPDLGAKIAERLGAELVVSELKIFSDGESKVTVGKTARNCVVVQSTYPPVDAHLMQALMLAKKCTDNGAHDVCAVIPYLAYARQDRAFLEGEVISISLIARLFQAAGIRHLVTVDVHSQQAMSYFSAIGNQNLTSIPLLAKYAASSMKLQKPVSVSPDAGGAERAKEFAELLNTDMLTLKKWRDRGTGQVTMDDKLEVEVEGRDAIIVDDMISSGASIARAAEVLLKNRANKIYAMCAHALLIEEAAQRIKSAGVSDIIATNSIPNNHAKVDLSGIIAAALKSRYVR